MNTMYILKMQNSGPEYKPDDTKILGVYTNAELAKSVVPAVFGSDLVSCEWEDHTNIVILGGEVIRGTTIVKLFSEEIKVYLYLVPFVLNLGAKES